MTEVKKTQYENVKTRVEFTFITPKEGFFNRLFKRKNISTMIIEPDKFEITSTPKTVKFNGKTNDGIKFSGDFVR